MFQLFRVDCRRHLQALGRHAGGFGAGSEIWPGISDIEAGVCSGPLSDSGWVWFWGPLFRRWHMLGLAPGP